MNQGNLVNTKLGKYEIRALIGRGGMGEVYRAYDPFLDRHVAIKVLAPHLAGEPRSVERFLREARAAARLRHPNIVTIYDVGQAGGWYYFVMEYLEGQPLTELIQHRGRLSPDDVLAIVQPLSDALEHAHERGLIHRDIKPANIVISPEGQVTLTDFGIAQAAQESRLTLSGSIVGTPEYMSPEQAKGLEVDTTTDQYSLAVVAYEMLTGKAPFRADSTMALLYKITQEPPPPIREARPEMPMSVEWVLKKGLSKNPGDRYPTITAFVGTLGRALEEVPAAEPVHAVSLEPPPQVQIPAPVPAPSRASSQTRRKVPTWVWVLGVAAVLALGAGGLAFANLIGTSGSEPPSEPVAIAAAEASPTSTSPPSLTPSARDAASVPTSTGIVLPRDTATATATSTATATASATATELPTETPTQRPTHTPRPTATRTPTNSAPPSVTPSPTATNAPRATPTTRPPTGTPSRPTATTQAGTSGALINFEQMGNWRRGDQPYGELSQSQEQARSGSYAGKLSYDFPVTDQDFVVFLNPLNLAGQPNTIGAWVYGDGSGHFLNAWIQDAQNQVWSVNLGKVASTGWQQMVGKLDPSLPWPSGHVSGPDNGVVDYPVRFYGLVLDRPGSGAQRGQIFIDDISAWRGEQTAQATATPAGAAITPTPIAAGQTPAPATSQPPPEEIGRIVFTVKAGDAYYLYSTDPTWTKMVEIGPTDWSHSTCAGGASAATLDGYTVNLYGVAKCAVSDSVDVCLSPNGQFKVVTNRVSGGHTVALWRASDNEVLEGYYQGSINKAAGIEWAPDSQRFLFTIGRSVHTAQVGSAGYIQIAPELDDTWPPQFSPDGSAVYYLKPVGSGGATEVYAVGPDGSNLRNLTNAPTAAKLCPRWRP